MLFAGQLMDPRAPRVRSDASRERCLYLFGPYRHLLVVDERGTFEGVVTRKQLLALTPRGLAGDVVQSVRTVPRQAPARTTVPLLLLQDGVVVVDPERRPAGLVSADQVVQLARFVLPPRWTVGEVMSPTVPTACLSHPRLRATEDARRGADALAKHGAPLRVVDRDGLPLGSLASGDVIRAVSRWLQAELP